MLAGLLGGCVTTADCDPGRTNIFSAAACAGTGRAQEREDEKAARARGSEAEAQRLRSEVQDLKSELKVRQVERQTLAQREIALDQDLRKLNGLLGRARSVEGIDRRRLEDLRERIGQLERRRADAGPPSRERLRTMEAEAGAMFEEMDALLGGEG